MADIVVSITGVQVRERVPGRVVDEADEVELIDMSPHALRQRMRHGNIYPPERAERALEQFFREGNLIALREMALRKMAHVCEVELEEYMQQQGIDAAWSAGERVMVCVDDQPQAQNLVRRGWRMANRYHTELLAVFVETPHWASASPEQKRALKENLRFAEDLGAQPIRVQGNDVAKPLMQVARDKNVGSIVTGHSRHARLHDILRGSSSRICSVKQATWMCTSSPPASRASADRPMRLSIGECVNRRYEIRALPGEGGMAEVYRALDKRMIAAGW